MRRSPAGIALVAAALVGLVAACDSSPTPRPSPPPSVASAVSTGVPPRSSTPAPSSAVAGVSVGVPSFDHVVVVVMENHAYDEIIGNRDAPYINSLAGRGALFTRSYATNHPSEPNYLVLFSGSAQGLTTDACPLTYSAANLYTSLHRFGRTFAGYSEGLPAVGSRVCSSGAYARKHNPWSNFTNVPRTLNRPLTAFPRDYSRLPTVSFVIPDLVHDMHDGSVATGDAWLRAHLARYAAWALTHRSLLVLTFDEDDRSAGNRIVTVFSGARVRPGRYSGRIDHYRVLRTIADAARVQAPGRARSVTPVTGVWTR